MTLDRRHFLQRAAAASLGFSGLGALSARGLADDWVNELGVTGYGPLMPDPEGIIDLPSGFSYHVISIAGETMSDGLIVPGKHDGMGAIAAPDGSTILIRNHEISPGHRTIGPFDPDLKGLAKVDQTKIYDLGSVQEGVVAPSRGGCTRLVYDTLGGQAQGRLIRHELALAGTEHNCAGGITPRGTWLSCEESIVGPDSKTFWRQPHGYVFEVPSLPGSGLVKPEPIIGMGRMNHEAVAVDPRTEIVYMTEDRNDSCLYRFIPEDPERYLEGGRLEALVITGHPQADTRRWETDSPVAVSQSVPVHWVALENSDAADDSLRYQAWEKGAARFARGEGMWPGKGEIYFACTTGGTSMHGQLWSHQPASPGAETTARDGLTPGGTLKLIAEPNDATIVEHADNLTVSPWGDLIVCEDGLEEQYLLGVTPAGEFYKFGLNAMNRSEFAGATFSPDGSTLFVNIQNPGLTLAIRGPWRKG